MRVNQNSYPIICPDPACDEPIGYNMLKNSCGQQLYAKIERARMAEHVGKSEQNTEKDQPHQNMRKDSKHHKTGQNSKNKTFIERGWNYFRRS